MTLLYSQLSPISSNSFLSLHVGLESVPFRALPGAVASVRKEDPMRHLTVPCQN